MKDINKLPIRRYAHVLDQPVRIEGDQETHGVDSSPDAIGGYYGMGWTEAFRCHRTGELYAVHCSDSVRGGKAAHSDRDLKWMEAMRNRAASAPRNESSRFEGVFAAAFQKARIGT